MPSRRSIVLDCGLQVKYQRFASLKDYDDSARDIVGIRSYTYPGIYAFDTTVGLVDLAFFNADIYVPYMSATAPLISRLSDDVGIVEIAFICEMAKA